MLLLAAAEQAAADFLTVTELADTLVRAENLSFRDAHHLVSAAVRHLRGQYSVAGMALAVRELALQTVGKTLSLSAAELERSLDPRFFVETRTIPGGPGALNAALQEAEAGHRQSQAWIQSKTALLTSYRDALRG